MHVCRVDRVKLNTVKHGLGALQGLSVVRFTLLVIACSRRAHDHRRGKRGGGGKRRRADAGAPLAWRLGFMGTANTQCVSSPGKPDRTEGLRAAVDGARRALVRCGHGTVHGLVLMKSRGARDYIKHHPHAQRDVTQRSGDLVTLVKSPSAFEI